MLSIVGCGAKDDLASSDDGSYDRQGEQVEFASDLERRRGWRGDADLVSFPDFVRGHEPIQKRILFIRSRRPRMAVAIPRCADVRAVRRGGGSESRRETPGDEVAVSAHGQN